MLDKLTQKYYNWSIPIINKASHEGEIMKIIKVKDQLEGAKVGLDILKEQIALVRKHLVWLQAQHPLNFTTKSSTATLIFLIKHLST